MTGLAPTSAGSHHRYAPDFALAAAVHPGQVRMRRADDGRAVRHIERERRAGGVRQAGQSGQRFGETNCASPRSCMLPMTVVRLTFRSARPCPAACLHLTRLQEWQRGVGDAQPPVGVAVKSEAKNLDKCE